MNSVGVTKDKSEALWEAIIKSDFGTVKSILNESPSLLNKPFGDYANTQISLQDGPHHLIHPTALQVAVNLQHSNAPDYSAKLAIVDYLLANNAEVNGKSTNGVTALHLAASRGNAPLVDKLIAHKADLNVLDDQQLSPFHYALKSNGYHKALDGHKVKLRVIFTRANCDPNTPETDSFPPLHYAVSNNDVAMMDNLIRLKVNVNRVDHHGRTALQRAIQANNIALAQKLVDANAYITIDVAAAMPSLLKGKSYKDYQLGILIEAVSSKNYDFIDFIIKTGIDLSVLLDLGMGQPTTTVSTMILEELLKIGLDPNIVDYAGNTLIEELYFNSNSQDGYNLLTKYSAYIPIVVARTLPNFDHASHQLKALKVGIQHNNPKIINLILKELQPDVAFIALKKGDIYVLEMLIRSGIVNLNAKDKDGNTLLHLSTNKEITRMLLHYGADVKIKDKHGRTPYEQATHKGYWDIVDLLVEKYGKSILPQSDTSATYDNDGTLNSMIQQGRALMKNQRYEEAERLFSDAIKKYNKDQLHDDNLLRRLKYWHLKSSDLKTLNPSPIMPLSLLKPVDVLMERMTDPTNIADKLSEVKHNRILEPFLTYLAFDFMFNERATIRVMGTCANRDTEYGKYTGVYLSASTVQIKNLLSNGSDNALEMTGTLVHELTHYYFNKNYQNNTRPYGSNQEDRKESFAKTKKDVLKNIAQYLTDNLESKPKFNIPDEMTSYQLGTYLNQYVNDNQAAWDILEKKNKQMADSIMKFLWLYDKNSAYSEDVEDIEFPVRLLQLIAQQVKDDVLELLAPLVKHYEDYFIPDCVEANKRFAAIADQLYTPPKYSPNAFEMAIGIDDSSGTIHCFSWNMNYDNNNTDHKTRSGQNLLRGQLTEVLHSISNHMQSDKPLDVITIQNVDPYRVGYIRDRLNNSDPRGNWVPFHSDGVVTFVNTRRLSITKTMTPVGSQEQQGHAVKLKKNDNVFSLINSVNTNQPEVYILNNNQDSPVNKQFNLIQVENLFNQIFQANNIKAALIIKQTAQVLLTNVVFIPDQEPEWLKPYKTDKPNEYLIPADSLLFKQLQLGLVSNNAFVSQSQQDIKPISEVSYYTDLALRSQQTLHRYEKARTKLFGIFRQDLHTAKHELKTLAISQFNMQLSDLLLNSQGTQLFDAKKKELQQCIDHLRTIASSKESLSIKTKKMLKYLSKANLTEDHKQMIKKCITHLQEDSKPLKRLEARKR